MHMKNKPGYVTFVPPVIWSYGLSCLNCNYIIIIIIFIHLSQFLKPFVVWRKLRVIQAVLTR